MERTEQDKARFKGKPLLCSFKLLSQNQIPPKSGDLLAASCSSRHLKYPHLWLLPSILTQKAWEGHLTCPWQATLLIISDAPGHRHGLESSGGLQGAKHIQLLSPSVS